MKCGKRSGVAGIVVLAGLMWTAVFSGAAGAAEEAFKEFICRDDHFTVSVPSEWVSSEGAGDSAVTRECGVDLRGPQNADGAYVSVAVIYYAPDHGRFKSSEDFIRVNADADDPLKIAGESVTPVAPTKIAGRDAAQFERKTFLFLPLYSVDQKKIPMSERLIVVKGEKGFYLLKYSSPEDLAEQYLPIFKRIIGSFSPKS